MNGIVFVSCWFETIKFRLYPPGATLLFGVEYMYAVFPLLFRINPWGTAVLHDDAEPSRLTLKFPVPKIFAVNNMVFPWQVFFVSSLEFSSKAYAEGAIINVNKSITANFLLFINYNPL